MHVKIVPILTDGFVKIFYSIHSGLPNLFEIIVLSAGQVRKNLYSKELDSISKFTLTIENLATFLA